MGNVTVNYNVRCRILIASILWPTRAKVAKGRVRMANLRFGPLRNLPLEKMGRARPIRIGAFDRAPYLLSFIN